MVEPQIVIRIPPVQEEGDLRLLNEIDRVRVDFAEDHFDFLLNQVKQRDIRIFQLPFKTSLGAEIR